MTTAVHWLHGIAWGGLYRLAEGSAEAHPAIAGTAFGSLVFANAYIVLPAMGLYDPPWQYGPRTLAVDWSYHAVYGVATAGAFRMLEPRGAR